MFKILHRLWNDDEGAILSVEMILVLGILIFGIIPGLVALRNGTIAAFGTIANSLVGFVPSFTYSGYLIQGNIGAGLLGTPIASTGGYSLSPLASDYLIGSQTLPIALSPTLVLSPAP